MSGKYKNLPYDPEKLERELTPYYISASEQDLEEMLKVVGNKDLNDLFSHIPKNVMMTEPPKLGEALNYEELIDDVMKVAKMNNIKTSFIGDGLKSYKEPATTEFVSGIRGLTTAYTPYQPERSQGTLHSLWIYATCLSKLTGFEAINASFYDRATCLHESLNTALRLKKRTSKVLVFDSIYPEDLNVLDTLSKGTPLEVIKVPVDSKSGVISLRDLKELVDKNIDDLAAVAFPQVNNFGNLENVHEIVDLCKEKKLLSIAIVDPILLATKALTPPSEFGSAKEGTDMIVGEGQHLAIGPNFGGPGLGIFGIRFNDINKTAIRSTAGRFVGLGKDAFNNDAFTMVLSTREQHIRREKATSNICSNQSFLATLAGAGMLSRGEQGMTECALLGREKAIKVVKELTSLNGVNLAFKDTPFYNEVTLKLNSDVEELIKKASLEDIHLGVNVSDRVPGENNLLLLSFFDIHSDADIQKLITFFRKHFDKENNENTIVDVPANMLRQHPVGLPNYDLATLKTFYQALGNQNVSPDDNIYPLGSCTMKYNPYINDYAASLPGFTKLHPQAPIKDAQGALHILHEIQESFKAITGMPGVTTQPVAGAQGELVGIKMFQAYHESKGEKRDLILIPRSAHGTNPATATMAGFETKKNKNEVSGIITIESNDRGQIDMEQLKQVVSDYGKRISGIMVTNPNTSGIFECEFREMADLMHSIDALVYMDGANMNAIAGWVDLGKLGVDAVHNNLHKTWTIPHGGGGPGDAIVAVSDKLLDFMPGQQVVKTEEGYELYRPIKSIGSFHRHFGNFAHKVRCYTYLRALGAQGVRKMSAVSVLSARYLFEKLKEVAPILPKDTDNIQRMHEFILTINEDTFDRLKNAGVPKAQAIAKIGKLFLDFGLHAPTVAFPEAYGLMVEPTESFRKDELDKFIDVVKAIYHLLHETPQVAATAPHFTPVAKVDEVSANKKLIFKGELEPLMTVKENKIDPGKLSSMPITDVCNKIIQAHESQKA